MTVHRIRLYDNAWEYDDSRPLGPAGGCGAVFAGNDQAGNEVTVKRLHLHADRAAHRELADCPNANLDETLERIDQIFRNMERVGGFAPVFIHHPDDDMTPIYPTIPGDIGQMILIARGLFGFIEQEIDARRAASTPQE